MFRYLKSAFAAAAIAAGTLLAVPGPASATPAASGLATSGIAGIAADASQVTKVGHRHRSHRRHWGGGPSFYFGLGSPYYYGGYPYYYGSPYYYRPRVRRYRHYGGGGRCARAHRACVARWGYGGGNYDGCMRYENCRPR
jgi:hypothetical protein